jgi:hypothetical protein
MRGCYPSNIESESVASLLVIMRIRVHRRTPLSMNGCSSRERLQESTSSSMVIDRDGSKRVCYSADIGVGVGVLLMPKRALSKHRGA